MSQLCLCYEGKCITCVLENRDTPVILPLTCRDSYLTNKAVFLILAYASPDRHHHTGGTGI